MEQKFAIYYNYQCGKRNLEAITNNPKMWIEEHNKERINEGYENTETLDQFEVERVQCGIYIYNN
jgi:hypothetical protein